MPFALPHRRGLSPLERLQWYCRCLTASRRALPDFVLIGAARTGSTSIFQYLEDHPSVLPCFSKEVRFYDRHYHEGVDWYRAHFPLQSELDTARRQGPVLTGEATPGYLLDSEAPDRLRSVTPSARLLVLLRNPVDRAISHFHYAHRPRWGETLPAEEALNPEAEWVDGTAFQPPFPPGAPSPPQKTLYLKMGHYAEQLENWLRVFPREQFLIRSNAGMKTHTPGFMNEVFGWLGLPPFTAREYPRRNLQEYEPVSPEVRQRLVEYYRPLNKRLYDLLGERFDWDR